MARNRRKPQAPPKASPADPGAKGPAAKNIGAGGAGIAPVIVGAKQGAGAKPAAAQGAAAKAGAGNVVVAKLPARVSLSGIAIKTVLTNLATLIKFVTQANQPSVLLPPKILGTLQQPDKTAGSNLQIEVLPPPASAAPPARAGAPAAIFGTSTSGSQVIATGLTDSEGNFSMLLPPGVVLPPGVALTFRVRGSSPTTVVPISVDPSLLGPTGYLGTMTLPNQLSPIPPDIYQQLQQTLPAGDGLDGTNGGTSPPTVPKLTLGDDQDCIRVLENQPSFEQYPYGIFFQLIAPALYTETETVDANQTGVYQIVKRTDTPANRGQLTGPISIDEFREGLLTGPAIVGSLGLGYVLRCSQNWSFRGLALGDLVYSLPLAPGEQQQIVVEEQTTTLAVTETESAFGVASSQASQASDESTQANFQSAFRQAAQGGSSYSTASETGSMSVGGGLLGILGGPSGSLGETISGGSSSSWMDGLQDYATNASQSVQTYSEQQSLAQRRAQRTAIRMATSSESTSVTTKIITNHNKLHALTMQYFEVLRLFDVRTSYDGVSLVCLVPLDIVWFLPPGQKEHLDDVITDSDLSNAIQYSTQLNSALQSIAAEVQMAIPFASIPFLQGFAQNTINNVNAQLGAVVNEATSLNALLSGLSASYAMQASEASQLLGQVNQAQTAITQYLTSSNVSDLQNALSAFQAGVGLATALYQQLSNPSVSGGMTRQEVLDRYVGLLAHSDVLKMWLPSEFTSGLTRLEKFAADPRASLVLDSLAEDVIRFSANASVLPFDHIYVAAVTRWGTRLGPVEMIPNPPVTVPGQFDPSKAFKTADDLLQYLQRQRNPGNATTSVLQASIALPRSLSPSDVVGFEITHSMDSFTYQLATPLDLFTSFFGTNGTAWPAGVLGGIGGLIAPPIAPLAQTYSGTQLAKELGPPYFWNFRADLTASVMGNPESYVQPDSSFIELPAGVYPIPAKQVAPLLKYSDLILIENTLQHVLRNIVRYSKAVWAWLTPEERVMLLEPYFVSFPGLSSTVPLLDCVGNVVLGFHGNCMMMPFSIPQALGESQGWPITTGQLEDSLLQFHRQSAPHEVKRTMLPTRGVLGEAMLGHCASGEKIDLTRFWNWQDSPADSAPAIAPVTVPNAQVPTLATAQAPNQLSGMLPNLVNNTVQAAPPSPNTSLLQALITAVLAQKGIDPSTITGASQLATLLQSTQSAAASARADQLKATTDLTSQAITTLGKIVTGPSSGGQGSGSGNKGNSSGSDSSGGSSTADLLAAVLPVVIAALA
ncbi:MAG TPA: hypothetical protein VGX94_18880 [Terriglobia bacterium]|nr:hypothetical protein [Terriglobia bacterium]